MNSNSNNNKVNSQDNTLQQLESYIRDFWQFLPLPICYLNPFHLFFDADQEMQKFCGYTSGEIIGELIDKVFADQDTELNIFKKEILENGLVNAQRIFLTTKTKEKIPVNLFAIARRDINNEVIGYFLAISDARQAEKTQAILESKVKERTKELEKSQAVLVATLEDVREARKKAEEEQIKTSAIINNYIDPIIVVDKAGKISLFNPAAKDILKLDDSLLGKKIAKKQNYSLENFREVIKIDFQVKSGAEMKIDDQNIEEVTLKQNDKELIYKVITAQVLGKNQKYLGVMKIFLNLTREKMLDRMKSEFISIAAHQLRTPLSAIKWVIKMILDGDAGKLNIEQQELLNKGYLSNERVIRLVNDLLNVSRIEEGKFGFNFETADFKEVLDIAISNVDSLVAKNHQELKVEIPPKLPKIYLDKERMIMVLQNLLDNAIKYTPEYGRIQIIVEVDKQYLHVKINDQGVGIPAADQSKMFSKFFRASNALKLETEGSGLGLFIVKNIIEKHKGNVSLKSEEGKGTEVSFTLPFYKA